MVRERSEGALAGVCGRRKRWKYFLNRKGWLLGCWSDWSRVGGQRANRNWQQLNDLRSRAAQAAHSPGSTRTNQAGLAARHARSCASTLTRPAAMPSSPSSHQDPLLARVLAFLIAPISRPP